MQSGQEPHLDKQGQVLMNFVYKHNIILIHHGLTVVLNLLENYLVTSMVNLI